MTKQILNFYAQFVSILLIPFLIPTYLCGIVLCYFPLLVNNTGWAANSIYIFGIFLCTVALPLLLVYLLFYLKKISSLSLYKREDRFIPQVFSSITYLAITSFLYYKLGIRNILTLAMLANSVSLITIAVITRFWKISTHASGVMGFLAIISMIYFKHRAENFLLPFIIIAVLCISVCFARIYLKAHTVSQVIGGTILGTLLGILVFLFLE